MKNRQLRLIFAAALFSVSCGGTPPCKTTLSTLTCSSPTYVVPPGACVELTNPCATGFERLDGFILCDGPRGLYVQRQHSGDVVTLNLCSAPDIEPFVDLDVRFYHARPNDTARYGRETGLGTMSVSIGTGVIVQLSASPVTIDPEQTSQISTTLLGGTPPFTYGWSPPDGLSATNISDPVASPTVTTTYVVNVVDSVGKSGSGEVTIDVRSLTDVRSLMMSVGAATTPAEISPDGSSQLTTTVTGGVPPYAFAWTPAADLNDPAIADPVARPPATTTYTVSVTDSLGTTAAGSVTVTVIPSGGLTACFTHSLIAPLVVQFDAGCTTGGSVVEYRWWVEYDGNPATPPSNVMPTSPVLIGIYELPGVYSVRLEVLDAEGNTNALIQQVSVPAS